jgi:PAS domain S-box-containing protein
MAYLPKTTLSRAFIIALLVLTYFLGAKLGFSLAFKHGSVAPVWPPTGIALAFLLLFGPSLWPAILFSAFLSNYILTPVGPFVSGGIAIGNTLEAVLGAYFLRKFFPANNYFSRFKNVVQFLLLGCVPNTLVSATIGTLSLALGKAAPWSDLPVLWFTWWISDLAGALVVMPWILSLKDVFKSRWRPKEITELFFLVLTGTLLAYMTSGTRSYPLAFIHIPVIVWAALRFGKFGASTIAILICGLEIRGTLNGLGQFALPDPNISLLMIQIFIVTSVVTAQLVAALVSERRKHIEELTSSQTGLQESEVRFRQLAENIREVFYISSPLTSKYLYISPAFENIWKRKRDSFYESQDALIATIYPEDKELLLSAIQKNFNGEATSNEYRIILPDGGINWIWDRAFPIKDASGKVCRVVGIAEDITLRKEVDEELRHKANELSRANRELEHFASVASHDLRAPLRTISSFSRLLQKKFQGKLDEEADQFIEFTVDGCKRMGQLIENLLRNARIGGKSMELQTLHLKEVVQEALDDLKLEIKEAQAHITIESLPTIKGDLTQLREVFQNLLSNAVKYRRNETPNIIVSGQRNKNEWVISVKDNGIGIASSARDRIFSNFVRLHTEGPYEGSGIGLATCKKVIEQRGGKIWVESVEGQGSVFRFTIPDNYLDLKATQALSPKNVGLEYAEDKKLGVKKPPPLFEILMVEDSPADSNIIEILLKRESFPFKIHVVQDGEEALNFLKRKDGYASAPIPSLILLDLNLPKLDGVAVLKAIKADSELRSIPVIVITSSVREEDIRMSYDLSASCYIKKPRDLNGYRDMLNLLRKFWCDQVQLPNTHPVRRVSTSSESLDSLR